MKVLSSASNYGLRALLYIVSRKAPGEYVSIGQISEDLDISFHFLTKTLQQLTHGGILISSRGPLGGVALRQPPENTRLIEVIQVLEGQDFFDKCMLGLEGCNDRRPCPVHHLWQQIKGQVRTNFETTTLADMGRRINDENLRLIP